MKLSCDKLTKKESIKIMDHSSFSSAYNKDKNYKLNFQIDQYKIYLYFNINSKQTHKTISYMREINFFSFNKGNFYFLTNYFMIVEKFNIKHFNHRFNQPPYIFFIKPLSPKMLTLLNPENLIQRSPSSDNKSRLAKSREPSYCKISNYEMRERLGKGSYAKVYKAIHLLTNQLVAVKVFNKAKMSKEDIAAVTSEVQIHKKLQHSNIARIYEYQETQNKIYIFMEYCQNGELFNYINSRGPLSQKKSSKIFKQILSAMKYLKSQRIFHRDIKCENILFDKNWNAKLVDFGFATRELDEKFSMTFCGSPSYTAPQLFTKPKYKAENLDVWCLGITLYAMLQGCLPFDGKQSKNTKHNIMEMKYAFKTPISSDAKQIFELIFVEDWERATIQRLQESNFVRNSPTVGGNYINTEIEQITVDPQIIEAIQIQFPTKNSSQIVQSVTQFTLDQNYSLYYLMVRSAISKGRRVRFDISSQSFQKRTKRMASIKLRKLSGNYRKMPTEAKKIDLLQSEVFSKKTQVRIRPSLVSIDVVKKRSMIRNNSVDSPQRKCINSLLARRIKCE